uniref:Transmembrane protein 268 n=1 Tax=Seriola dumerili TaxID=41447 RepID=A0A3B4VCC2_SERDU
SEMMADRNGVCHVMESEVDAQIRQTQAQPQANNNRPNWSNGQCVVSVPSCSSLNPSFDLSLCRAKLENDGFQIPISDMEAPLKAALDVPSVRRYMVFNSALFHFIMAPINMNLDVRLIQVNERMVKHKLLVAVADWVQNCTGNMQLYVVYWDMSRCLRALTETLEEHSFVANDTQRKLRRKMSHLVLVSEVTAADPEVSGSDVEQDLDEQRPLLGHEDTGCRASSSQREDAKVTTNYSLIPDLSLPPQAKAYQLLMTYSAAYVKLLVSERLSGPSHHRLRSRRNHCNTAPLCLCQYIKKKILR